MGVSSYTFRMSIFKSESFRFSCVERIASAAWDQVYSPREEEEVQLIQLIWCSSSRPADHLLPCEGRVTESRWRRHTCYWSYTVGGESSRNSCHGWVSRWCFKVLLSTIQTPVPLSSARYAFIPGSQRCVCGRRGR